jgi:hypothetical protein
MLTIGPQSRGLFFVARTGGNRVKFDNVLKWAVRLSAVGFTSPATWRIASGIYAGPLGVFVAGCALVLVEGAFLLSWWSIDHDSKAAPAQRALYAVLLVVSYLTLLAIGVSNEGIVGLVFRLSLGVVVAYSIAQAGALASIRLRRAQERKA